MKSFCASLLQKVLENNYLRKIDIADHKAKYENLHFQII